MTQSQILNKIRKYKSLSLILIGCLALGWISATVTEKTYKTEAIAYIRIVKKAVNKDNASSNIQGNEGYVRSNAQALWELNAYTISKVQTYINLLFFSEVVSTKLSAIMGEKIEPFEDYDLKITAQGIWRFYAVSNTPEKSARLANALVDETTSLIDNLESLSFKNKYEASLGSIKVQQAQLQETPISPRPGKNLFIAIILGVVLTLSWERLKRLTSTKLKDSSAVAKEFNIRCLTILPNGFGLKFSDQIKHLRSGITSSVSQSDTQAVLITSCIPGQGTSSVVRNLAHSIAEIGKSVCVIQIQLHKEFDVEETSLFQYFDFSDCFVKPSQLEEILSKFDKKNPIYGSFSKRGNLSSEDLQSEQFDSLLTHLNRMFDFILIDAPPVLVTSDGVALATKSSKTLLVVSHDTTTKTQLRNVLQALSGVGVKPMGFIFNNVPEEEILDLNATKLEKVSSTNLSEFDDD